MGVDTVDREALLSHFWQWLERNIDFVCVVAFDMSDLIMLP